MSAIQYCGLILIMLNARLPLHDQIITGVIRRLHSQSGYESNGDFSTVTMLHCAWNMKSAPELVLLFIYVLGFYVALPAAIIAGWFRWAKRQGPATTFSILSSLALGLATCSALLALGTRIYAHAIGGFPFYDPRLMRIYRWGLLLSLGGIVLGLIGCWRRSPLRWLAPACAAGIFIFWWFTALSE